MNLMDLTPAVRTHMASEVELDAASPGGVYAGERLTATGERDYPGLLTGAARNHDPAWLAGELRRLGRMKDTETYFRNGKQFSRKVPVTAADTLAEGEFNRFYCRGVCLLALEGGEDAEVEVYRAKEVSQPRPESEAIRGRRYKAAALLVDLRTSRKGIDVALGVPAGPNSGLSVRLVPRKPEPTPAG